MRLFVSPFRLFASHPCCKTLPHAVVFKSAVQPNRRQTMNYQDWLDEIAASFSRADRYDGWDRGDVGGPDYDYDNVELDHEDWQQQLWDSQGADYVEPAAPAEPAPAPAVDLWEDIPF